MIKKIISGGQTGADRAALDVAIKLNISHGGWIPKGRLAEDGTIPDRYELNEMPTESYPARTEYNVIDSDGTLIISHGKLAGGSAHTRKMAMKHGKPWFHADLNKLPTFQAAMIIEGWCSENNIEILNVAGPRHSEDNLIYGLVTVIIELVLNLITAKKDRPEEIYDDLKTEKPEKIGVAETVDEVVDILISKLSLKDKSTIAHMSSKHFFLILYFVNYYK